MIDPKTEAVENIVAVFQAQNERMNILSERIDMLLENAKTSSEVSVLLANRVVSLEKQLHTVLEFIVKAVSEPTDDEKDVH